VKTPLAGLALLGLLAAAFAAPVPKGPLKTGGILVLDDSDEVYKGKAAYEDNLHFFGTDGKERFHLPGFNNCQSIGGSRMIATDPARKIIWVIENVAHRVRRIDPAGKEQACIENVTGSALAVDPETGNVWVTEGPSIGKGTVVVYSAKGEHVATHAVSGWDIVYDPKGKAFWAADRFLTKLAAKDGKVLARTEVSKWCASSLAVNPVTGDVWVAVREHPQVAGSANELIRFDGDGAVKATVALEEASPSRVAVDPKSGNAWVTAGKGARVYSPAGKLERTHDVEWAIGVEIDPNGDGAWVLTRTDTRLLTEAGKEMRKVAHRKPTDQAWIAAYKE